MSESSDGSLEQTANLFDFISLYMDHKALGEVRELGWYLKRFPGDDAALAREYLALTDAAERTPDELFAGRYEILRELGRGGQGVVSLARDTLLRRRVALKTVMVLGQRLERLRREAEIASSLDHPGICAIYEANFDHSPPYVAMRYIEGDSLSKLLSKERELPLAEREDGGVCPLGPIRPEEINRVLAMIESMARALHAAHELGIVHRDIKPANVIITPEGDPVVLDFGLARLEEPDASGLTLTGEAVGTPAYMSPEQISGSQHLNRTTDVYALGVTLYECLTLSKPFTGTSRSSIEWAVLNSRVIRPCSINPGLPRELDAVLAVALDSDPQRRYASAELFADDLRRIQRREPILASPPSAFRRARRWVQRNPRVSFALVVLSGLLALIGNLYLKAERRGDERLVEVLTRVAIDQADERPGYAYAVATEAHRRAPDSESTNDALLSVLLQYRDHRRIGPFFKEAFDWEGAVAVGTEGKLLRVLDTASWTTASTLESSARIERLDLSPDGTRLLVGDESGRATLWDLDARSILSETAPSDAPVTMLLGHWETGHAYLGDEQGRLFRWSLEGGEAPELLHDYPAEVSERSVMSNDGTRLVTFSWMFGDAIADSIAHVWDAADGRLAHTLSAHAAPLLTADFSADTAWLATGSHDGIVHVWDVERGVSLASLVHPGKVIDVEFGVEAQLASSCDPGDLAVESGDSAFVWDWMNAPDSPRLAFHQAGSRSTYAVAFDPDGDRIATASLDGNVILWDSASGSELDRCQVNYFAVDLRWRGEDEILIGSNEAHFVWTLRRRAPCALVGHAGAVLGARFSPDGSRAVTASSDGTARIWEVASARCLHTLQHDAVVRFAEFSPDGRAVLTGCDDGDARVWTQDGQLAVRLGPHTGRVTHGRFLDAGRVVTASDAGELRLWDLQGNLLRDWVGHTGPIQEVRIGPDAEFVATGGSDRSARLWSAEQSTPILVTDDWDHEEAQPSQTRVFDVVFSPDGRTLVSAGEDTTVRGTSLAEGDVETLFPLDLIGRVGFLSDERPLLTQKWRGNLVDCRDGWGGAFQSHPIHTSAILQLAVAPQGLVLTTSADGTGFLMRLEDHELVPHMRLVGHEGQVTDGAFSPDGQLVITASLDGTARLWPVFPAESGPVPRELLPHERAALGLDGGTTRASR